MSVPAKTIFVTGGAGFIGSAVIRHFLNETDHFIVNVDKLTYAAQPGSIPRTGNSGRYRLEQVDICDGSELRRIFSEFRPAWILNLAAESHVDRSIEGPAEFIRTNLVGTYTLLEEALRYWRMLGKRDQTQFRLVHVSTDEVFGSLPEQGFFTEETRYAPNSPYSATKAGSDHLVRAWRETYGLPTLITNCSNNFGPYQFPEKLIPHMVLRGLAGKSLPVYGDGSNVRDWLYVEDHARALALVLAHGVVGESYNVGARSERTNKELVETICDMLDELCPRHGIRHRSLIEFVADRPGHDRRYAIDPSKIEQQLGWRPQESLESGLMKTVKWYLENQSWWQAIVDGGYQPERLGLIASAEAAE